MTSSVQRIGSSGSPSLHTELREGRVELDSVLGRDPERRKWLAQRQANYLAWAAEFAPACAGGPPLPPEQRLFWTHRIELAAGLGLRLVGLNTALLSADDADRGRLWLGKQQLDMALFEPPIEPQDLTLILSHHPLHSHWMADEQNADAWIATHAHLHLFGHVHEADSEHARRGAGGQFVCVVAGAVHGEEMPAEAPRDMAITSRRSSSRRTGSWCSVCGRGGGPTRTSCSWRITRTSPREGPLLNTTCEA